MYSKLKNTAIIFICIFGLTTLPTVQSQTVPDPPDIGDTTVCRCKPDGCKGGNQISLRPACGRIEGVASCDAGSTNC